MDLKKYYGRGVVIVTDDGQTFSGVIDDYISPDDNENGKESIILTTKKQSLIEFYEDNIKEIIVY